MTTPDLSFAPERHEESLVALIDELVGEMTGRGRLDGKTYERIVRRHPKAGAGFFSKSDVIRGFRHLNAKLGWRRDERRFVETIRMKPVRTLSGVAPVTVLTKPFPCPGRCVFCPSDVRMPKSYLSDEPGAQRAAQHRFDPYLQTLSRLRTYHNIGHRADKVELIVLGGTWSSYDRKYQRWFVKRCLDAMNDFVPAACYDDLPSAAAPAYEAIAERVDGQRPLKSYNQIVAGIEAPAGGAESASWEEVVAAQERNESAARRCVGLVLETRPDHVSLDEAVRLRRLGATKIQIGIQSLSDSVLTANGRGHDVATTRRALVTLRQAGFKIHAHWMPNLLGSTPAADLADFERLFSDRAVKPDELKIYPCSLIESAELMQHYESGEWRPYDRDELLEVLVGCLRQTPEYCRLSRVIRDIPGTDIVAGNRTTNFRELAERELARRGLAARDIRAREVRELAAAPGEVRLKEVAFETEVGEERFLQFVTPEDRIAGFLRLSLPARPVPFAEIATSALIREVHVYGHLVSIGGSRGRGAQHAGLGTRLVRHAQTVARAAGFADLAVISAIGTRHYYRGLGFADGSLYQHLRL